MDCSGSNKRPRVGFGYAERQDARVAKQVWAEVTRAEVTPKEKEELTFESFSDQRREEFLVEMTKVADDEHEKRMMVFRNEGMDKAVALTAMQRLQRAKPEDETWIKKSYFSARLIEITHHIRPEVIALTRIEFDGCVLSNMAIIAYNKDMDVHKIRAARTTSDVQIFTVGGERVFLGGNARLTHLLEHGDMVIVRGLREPEEDVQFKYEEREMMEVQVS